MGPLAFNTTGALCAKGRQSHQGFKEFNMARSRIQPAEIPPGEILTYYGDLASGAIRPEDVRIEALTFRAVIDQNGQIQFQSPKITVVSRYNFAFRGVWGQIVNAPVAGAAAGLVRFQVREQGRSFDVFKQPVSFGAVVENPYHWDGVYITVPGTDLEVSWTVDTALWTNLVGQTRIVEVVLVGDYIACAPTQQ
jgi:hypothetical protein